jgi:ribosomal protein S17
MHRTNNVQQKSKSPLSVFEKNMILNIYKHACDEHAELKVGDTVKLKKSRYGNWMSVLK